MKEKEELIEFATNPVLANLEHSYTNYLLAQNKGLRDLLYKETKTKRKRIYKKLKLKEITTKLNRHLGAPPTIVLNHFSRYCTSTHYKAVWGKDLVQLEKNLNEFIRAVIEDDLHFYKRDKLFIYENPKIFYDIDADGACEYGVQFKFSK